MSISSVLLSITQWCKKEFELDLNECLRNSFLESREFRKFFVFCMNFLKNLEFYQSFHLNSYNKLLVCCFFDFLIVYSWYRSICFLKIYPNVVPNSSWRSLNCLPITSLAFWLSRMLLSDILMKFRRKSFKMAST